MQHISIVEASKYMRGKRPGQGPHVDTIRRWANKGYHNPMTNETVVLEVIQVGGQMLTTLDWVKEFERRRHAKPEKQEVVVRTTKVATRAQRRASAELDAAGLGPK